MIYIYSSEPMDLGWKYLREYDEIEFFKEDENEELDGEMKELHKALSDYLGELAGTFYVMPFPRLADEAMCGNGSFEPIITTKSSHAGTTYYATHYPLPNDNEHFNLDTTAELKLVFHKEG